MNRFLTVLFLFFSLSSCENKSQTENNNKILGDWHLIKIDAVGTEDYDYMPGLSFYKNLSFDNRSGYFKDDTNKEKTQLFIGTKSAYKLVNDSLNLLNPAINKWSKYKITKLDQDTLNLKSKKVSLSYSRISPNTVTAPQFDEIIVSTSGCFGWCPRSNTVIRSDGTVIFQGLMYTRNKGLYMAKIPTVMYQKLQDNFRRANFKTLKNNYTASISISDQETICTTFIKEGEIYKSVSEYAHTAPELFRWAYLPVEYLYQEVHLKEISDLKSIPSFSCICDANFCKGNMVCDLKQSETFLLLNYLRNGKISITRFNPVYKMHTFYDDINRLPDIETDGRFYRFTTNGKPVTIGFNFYDVNLKNWVWQKSNEYD